MKLSELKVGMAIRKESWAPDQANEIVVFVAKDGAVVTSDERDEFTRCYRASELPGFIEVKPKQLPSDRVRQIELTQLYNPGGGDLQGQINKLDKRVHAILHYLDFEQAEKELPR